jgi:hypothetical protein
MARNQRPLSFNLPEYFGDPKSPESAVKGVAGFVQPTLDVASYGARDQQFVVTRQSLLNAAGGSTLFQNTSGGFTNSGQRLRLLGLSVAGSAVLGAGASAAGFLVLNPTFGAAFDMHYRLSPYQFFAAGEQPNWSMDFEALNTNIVVYPNDFLRIFLSGSALLGAVVFDIAAAFAPIQA